MLEMASAEALLSGTADETISSEAETIVGFSVSEEASADAEVIIRNGTSTNGDVIIPPINLSPDETVGDTFEFGVRCPDGVFVERVSGTTEVVILLSSS